MSKFKIPKRIELAKLGEVYKDSYIELESPSVSKVKEFSRVKINKDKPDEATESSIKILKDLFISGKLPGENGLVDVTKDDLLDVPIEVVNECFLQLVNQDLAKTNPNS